MTFNEPKWALITGAAKRIGKEIAVHLASKGYAIVAHYHTSQRQIEETVALVQKKGVQCFPIACDLGQEEKVLELIPNILKKIKSLDVLVNNASVFEKATLQTSSLEQLNRHWHINLQAPYLLTQQFALLCKKGHIINILDTAICKNRTQHLPYLLTKKALANFTELSAIELAPYIKVNAVSPGVILAPENEEESYLVEKIKEVPLGIKGKTSQIAEAVQFLLEAHFVTGQIIYIDGGQHL